MSISTVMRCLRLKHSISLRELSDAAGVSHQYMSDIELGKYGKREVCETQMRYAFEKVIEQRSRRNTELAADYAGCRDRLLDTAMEGEHES